MEQVEQSPEYTLVQKRLYELGAMTQTGDVRAWSRERYAGPVDGYTKERAALHEKITSKILIPDSVAPEGKRPRVVFLMGAPGTGKTTAGQPLVKKIVPGAAAVVNADDIKEMLPEYLGWNAGALHHESTDILEGTLMRRAIAGRHNMVLDLTGNNAHGLKSMAEALARRGYDVHIVKVDAPTHVAVARAWHRFLRKGRFVPPRYVEKSDHKADVTYDMLKSEGYVKSWASVDTSGEYPVLVERGTR